MRYAVCLEWDTDGRSMAHVPDLPGCYARGGDPRAALDNLFVAIPAYWAWLRRHGLPAPGPAGLGAVTLAVVEIVRDGAPGATALFEYEVTAAINRQGVSTCLARLAYSRADLLALLQALPPAAQAPGPAARSATILTQLAAAERWYTRLLGPGSRLKPSRTPLERLANVRAAAVHQIEGLPDAAYDRVFAGGGERWSLRKLLRRMIEQERESTAEIAALFAIPLPEAPPAPASSLNGG
ncbi:MAG TPA: type II toxin-antitoxin system HicB family antitoxin [Chloroflexia bacterium]|nr:type II toxin-antitoxin system HicB family antitoxin [Chloroflexia bacterium]